MPAAYTMGLEPNGRELLVIAVKGTFRIPAEAGGPLVLHEEQVPLIMSDVFFGEPGMSAPKYEVDFAPNKHLCDISLVGSAYGPRGDATARVLVGLKIGGWSKSFEVVGDRTWFISGGPRVSAPAPFLKMPITYDLAFGGSDVRHEDPAEHATFSPNPTGRGFHKHLTGEWLDGAPLPNTEEVGAPIERPDGSYRPMSFGVLGRNWEPRVAYAGTYDQGWLDNTFPFLPGDFDARYYQSAPADQQLSLPVGVHTVSLSNLTPAGHHFFQLQVFEAPIHIFPRSGKREDFKAIVDTIVIEPDLDRLTMTWRVARPLRKNMFEIAQILIGRQGARWWEERKRAKFPIPVVVEPVRVEPAT